MLKMQKILLKFAKKKYKNSVKSLKIVDFFQTCGFDEKTRILVRFFCCHFLILCNVCEFFAVFRIFIGFSYIFMNFSRNFQKKCYELCRFFSFIAELW
jgi:hypothetical protein